MDKLLTEIGNRAGGFFVMGFTLIGSPHSRRWRWWRRSHAGSWTHHNCSSWWSCATSVSMIVTYLGLRWYQYCVAACLSLWWSSTPTMQHPYGTAHFRLQFGGPVSRCVSHLRYGEPAVAGWQQSHERQYSRTLNFYCCPLQSSNVQTHMYIIPIKVTCTLWSIIHTSHSTLTCFS